MRWLTTENSLWALGLGLLSLYGMERVRADMLSEQAVGVFAAARVQQAQSATPDQLQAPDHFQWSASRVRSYAAAMRAPGQGVPAAVLRIPALRFTVPVFDDVSERNLDRGAGLIPGMAAPGGAGNLGIAAHRDGFFRILKDVVVGDRIEVESFSGTWVYRVTDLSIVNPDDTRSLRPTSETQLTLVTCYPFYFAGSAPQRYVVRALAESPQELSSND